MQTVDNAYLKGVNYHKNTNPMHDLKANFDKILPIVKQTLADQLDTCGNLHVYPNKPDLPDTHIITLSLLQQTLSIDSEIGIGVSCKPTTPRPFRTCRT